MVIEIIRLSSNFSAPIILYISHFIPTIICGTRTSYFYSPPPSTLPPHPFPHLFSPLRSRRQPIPPTVRRPCLAFFGWPTAAPCQEASLPLSTEDLMRANNDIWRCQQLWACLQCQQEAVFLPPPRPNNEGELLPTRHNPGSSARWRRLDLRESGRCLE